MRWLSFFTGGAYFKQFELVTLSQLWQINFFAAGLGVSLKPAVKEDVWAWSFENGYLGVASDSRNLGAQSFGVRHLAGHRALPNQLIKLSFLRASAGWANTGMRWANSLVGLLSVLTLGFELFGLWVIVAKLLLYFASNFIDSLLAKVGAIGTHVTNIASLIELLSQAHGNAWSVTQTGGGGLL